MEDYKDCSDCVWIKVYKIRRGEYKGKWRCWCDIKSKWIDDLSIAKDCDKFDGDSWVK